MPNGRRSAEAIAHRKLYAKERWKRVRKLQLQRSPLCEWCQELGTIKEAEVVHHATPHKGNIHRFFNGPFVSLCKWHHDNIAAKEEALGIVIGVNKNGEPLDPNHFWNT